MQSALSDQAQACADKGNQYPFCTPTSSDVWVNGTTHDFVWNFNYPYYVAYEKVSLYLYYIIKYEYVSVKNFTDLDRVNGGAEVTVDDSWFLNSLAPGSSPQNLTMAGFYLPSNFSPYVEISSPISMFPRPFNFTVTQLAPAANGTNNSNSTTNTNSKGGNNGSNNNNNTNNNSSNSSLSSSPLPGWAIAVIVIAVVAFICGATALIWAVLASRRNKRNNKLIPVTGVSNSNNDNSGFGGRRKSKDNASINSQTKVNAYRSTDSVPMTTASHGENASSIGTLAYATPLAYDSNNNKLSSSDAVLLADTFRNTLGRSTNDWNTAATIGEEEEELKRRRLGEALLQRQLEEDGTSVKHAGRFTRVKSLADIPKSAVFEHPKY